MLERPPDYGTESRDTVARAGQPESRRPGRGTCDEIWLLGQPPLDRYLQFIEEAVVGGDKLDRAELVKAWCSANDYYRELERTEAGIANQAECRDLDPGLAALAAQVKTHPWYRHAFDTVPTCFGVVELDRLIVFQKHVTRNAIDALKARIGPAPDAAASFRVCLPLEPPSAPVEIRRFGSRRYVFRCDSTDFRFHEPTLLKPAQAPGYESFGAIAGIVGLVVGFGSNFLNVIKFGKRLLLNNGYHRACALRALGVRYAPCIIQMPTRGDDLEIVLEGRLAEDAEFYFESARPPILKDFFDPRIRKVWPTHRRVRIIEVNFDVKDFLVPG